MSAEIDAGLTLEAFGERVAAIARAHQPGTTVDFVAGDALALSITRSDGTVLRTHLDNLWRAYKRATSEGGGFAVRDVEAFLAGGDPLGAIEPGVDDLVMTVRHVSIVDDIAALDVGNDPSAPPRQLAAFPFVADLALVLAFDLPTSIRLCMAEDVTRLGLTPDAAFQKGVENALSRLKVERVTKGPLRGLVAGGSYEASLLLATGMWRQLAETVPGPLVVGVPCRDVLLFTGEDVPGGVLALAGFTEYMYRTGDHPVSPVLPRFTDEGWVPLDIGGEDDAGEDDAA